MFVEKAIQEHTAPLDIDVEQALNPVEAEGVFRDTRECAGAALLTGTGNLLLSPPAPRPVKPKKS